jgi:hypothetical protein
MTAKKLLQISPPFSVVHTTLHGLVTQILFSFQKG